jgi:hypothetical protein
MERAAEELDLLRLDHAQVAVGLHRHVYIEALPIKGLALCSGWSGKPHQGNQQHKEKDDNSPHQALLFMKPSSKSDFMARVIIAQLFPLEKPRISKAQIVVIE